MNIKKMKIRNYKVLKNEQQKDGSIFIVSWLVVQPTSSEKDYFFRGD